MEAAAKSDNTTTEQKPPAAVLPAHAPTRHVDAPAPTENGNRKYIIGAIIAAVVLGGGYFGLNTYMWSRDHVETDDAFITGNLVNVSPKIGGRLAVLDLSEGDTIKKGQ